MNRIIRTICGWLALALSLAAIALGAAAQEPRVGTAEFVRGEVSALRDGATGRHLASGDELYHQEIIETRAKSFAVLAFDRGGKVSVRPLTRVRLMDAGVEADREHAMRLTLEKGGLHGRIEDFDAPASGKPAEIVTPVATLSIMDAEFVARWCEDDCAGEAEAQTGGTSVAKALVLRGFIEAGPPNGRARKLVAGDVVFENDIIRTGKSSYVLLLFRDGGRATLDELTVLEISEYLYQPALLRDSRVKMNLKKGKGRFQTGIIGKKNPDYYKILTATFVAGVRGTGFDIACVGDCVDENFQSGAEAPDGSGDGTYLSVWEGSVVQTNDAGSLEVGEGQTSFVASRQSAPLRISRLPTRLEPVAPRPDEFGVDPEYLFQTNLDTVPPPGLYVQVSSGSLEMTTPEGQQLRVSEGRTGYVDPAGVQMMQTTSSPGFMQQQGSCP